MNEQQADKIIELLETISGKLSTQRQLPPSVLEKIDNEEKQGLRVPGSPRTYDCSIARLVNEISLTD